ncbi:hypothetical protein WDU94_003345 [Cyamophila willieti]
MVTAKSKWDDKDEFLDVIYWSRQILGIILGIIWGLIPLRGFIGIALFALSNAGTLYLYIVNYQQVDEDDYGGTFEMAKEGFMTSFAGFLVSLFNLEMQNPSPYNELYLEKTSTGSSVVTASTW